MNGYFVCLYQMYFASGTLSNPNEISLCHNNEI